MGGVSAAAAAFVGRPAPVLDPPVVKIERGTLTSKHWPGRSINWVVTRPEGPSHLVIALHSLGTSANWFVERLDAPGVSRRTGLTVAAVDGGRHYWHRHNNGIDTAAMVVDDFLPLVAALGLDTDRFALTGVSMGGFGALRLAAQLGPTRVMGVGVVAPALRRTPLENPTLMFDNKRAFEANNPFGKLEQLREIPCAIACGKQDAFYAASKAMAAALPGTPTIFDKGGHTTRYVASHWEPIMHWLAYRCGPPPERPFLDRLFG
ncbi:alpha/beta fold hydrolase [Dermatophilus congolensis]|uniref:alpha/beta fold hydrolase n=1 Tax=Dermatophilus congolensis TaxID=1863 RepID=UPI001AAFF13B|nr:alpha/beta hydrolase [Dermatophilus congolensis]MBO3130278.1 alpha/beta hydrolase [Dermatophilus congolensis]MBO3131091.1 alpha/beta hydrolase [Dermatophilus congolensis]MBO3134749.1 alpha/beta hydrolase [Dermatophilus congolensis]MBO3136985.1 alpha/beta hydrolase [Dermatophilus congolensis]MBO3139230.1 alpha/beta hydrolase [Dermatophilus congolensis]